MYGARLGIIARRKPWLTLDRVQFPIIDSMDTGQKGQLEAFVRVKSTKLLPDFEGNERLNIELAVIELKEIGKEKQLRIQ